MSARALLTESVLLSAEPVSDYFVIDADKRQIIPPTGFQNFGVESDEKSKRIYFQCPRVVGDNLDLTTLNLRVNYQNAKGEKDSYIVDDVAADGDTIYFSWLLRCKVTLYSGSVTFIVCAVKTDTDGVIVNEWNTSIATGIVLTGLEVETPEIPEDVTDLVSQLLDVTNKAITDMQTASAESVAKVQAAETEAVNNIAASLDSTLSISGKAAESSAVGDALKNKAPVIVVTKTGESIVVNNAAQSALKGLKLYGKTTQDGTPTPDAPIELVSVESPAVTICGKNLLANNLATHTNGGVTFTQNTDGSITIDGTVEKEVYYTFDFGNPILCKGIELVATLEGAVAGVGMTIGYFDDEGNVVNSIADTTGKEVAFYYPDKATRTRTFLYVHVGTTFKNTVVYPMIKVVGSNPEYEPHKNAQTLSLPYSLHGIPVDTGGNYTDADGQEWLCDEIDLERGVYVQRIKAYTLDDSYAMTFVSANETRTRFDIDRIKGVAGGKLLCDSLEVSTSQSVNTTQIHGDTGKLIIFTNVAATIEDFKAYLADNPMNFLIQIEPTEIALTADELAAYKALYTNYPVTTLLNDQDAHMELSYAADTDIYIKQHYVSVESYNDLAARVAALEAGGV